VQTDWAPKDFGKPNIQTSGAVNRLWNPSSATIWHSENRRIVIELAFGAQSAYAITAWPASAYLAIELPDQEGPIQLDLTWFDKRSNRLPEAFWLTFQPKVSDPRKWSMSKVERPVSPFDVVTGGNRHMHALNGPLSYQDTQSQISIESLDAAVVSLGVMSPVFFSNDQPDLTQGFHYSLFNNGWGTNYVQWFGENARFRFHLSFA
jgi:hypothetical protein